MIVIQKYIKIENIRNIINNRSSLPYLDLANLGLDNIMWESSAKLDLDWNDII